MWEGPRHSCGFAAAGSSCYKMWMGLNGFDPRTDFVLGGVRIGMDLHESSYCYFKVYAGTRNLNGTVREARFVQVWYVCP